MTWLARILAMWLLMAGIKATMRYGPPLALRASWCILWPSVLLAWGLRRRVLPLAETRWPRYRLLLVWGVRGLGVIGLCAMLVTAEHGGTGPVELAAAHATRTTLALVAAPLGMAAWGEAGRLAVAGLPLTLVLALVLAGWWPFWAGVLRGAGFEGKGSILSLGKTSRAQPTQGDEPVRVTLRPRPTQAIATGAYPKPDYDVEHLVGRGMLIMYVSPPGLGKTELIAGVARAPYDGERFCGLATKRPRKIFLLSEMDDPTLQGVLCRWGLYVPPTGRLDALRQRWCPDPDSPGHYIHVEYATNVYKPRRDGRKPQWADVVQAVVPKAIDDGYDWLIVDSLGRWMKKDASNDAMLDALGALRPATAARLAVLVLHHPAVGGKRPRGGGAIEGECDIVWTVTGLGGRPPAGIKDPVRRLECLKTRFAETTPETLTVERVYDPGKPDVRPRYRLYGPQEAAKLPALPEPEPMEARPVTPAPMAVVPEQAAQVLAVLTQTEGATVGKLVKATGLGRSQVTDSVAFLVGKQLAERAGTAAAGEKGGRPAMRYRAAGTGGG